jgi:hypothetical protein
MAGDQADWRLAVREANEKDLFELVERHHEEVDVKIARQILRNPFVSRRVIETLLRQRRLLTSAELRRDLAAHRQTPEARALNLIPGLFWKDLVALGSDARVAPRLRRAADLRLAERVPQLSTGERMAIARQAGPGVIPRLRHDSHPQVVAALLENPKLTEGLLLPLLTSETANPQVLTRVAEDRTWGVRYGVKNALCRNPRTPVPTALSLLSGLKKQDLKTVAANLRIAAPVRRRAELLLGR